MTEYLHQHLIQWLQARVPEQDRPSVYAGIVTYMTRYPDSLALQDGWPTVRERAEQHGLITYA